MDQDTSQRILLTFSFSGSVMARLFDVSYECEHSPRVDIVVGHMRELVAVERPYAGIVGDEDDVSTLSGTDFYCVFYLGLTGYGVSIQSNHFELVGMGVHVVLFVSGVDDPDPYALTFTDVQRLGVGE